MPHTPNPELDIKTAIEALQCKQDEIALYLDAYSGKFAPKILSRKLKQVYDELDVGDVDENWAAVVIDACADKITLEGLSITSEQAPSAGVSGTDAQSALNRAIAQTELLLEADDAHKYALICGQSFIVVWSDGAGGIELFYHKAHTCHIEYDADNPNRAIYAVKWWFEDARKDKSHIRIKLYYPNALYTFRSTHAVDSIKNIGDVEQVEEAPNPYGIIPIFAFQPDRRDIVSDLRDVIPIQLSLNLLNINELTTSEFAAFAQKYIISNAEAPIPVVSAPNSILHIPAASDGEQPVSVGEFQASQMTQYSQSIERRIQSLAAITRTPLHYFRAAGGTPSGDALIALEAPLNNKAWDRIDRFRVTWRKLAAFILQILGYSVQPEDIEPQFARPETIQPSVEAMVYKTWHDAELPTEANLRRANFSDAEIAEIVKEQKRAKRESIATAIAAFNRGGVETDEDDQDE